MYRKRITLKDIAAAAGVSTTTVSLILNGRSDVHIGEETKSRVLSAADQLGYVFTPSRKNSASPIVCFIHGDVDQINIGTSFFGRIASLLRGLCEEHEIGFIEFEFGRMATFAQYQNILSYRPVAFVTAGGSFVSFHQEQKSEIPLFILQGNSRFQEQAGHTTIYNVDDFAVGKIAAEHLFQRGFRYCGMVFPHFNNRCYNDRFLGFTSVFEKLGGEFDHIRFSTDDHRGLVDWFTAWDRGGFDSFYFFSDAMAIPGIRGLSLQGVRIPEDIGVIGTDNLYWGAYTVPSLTTMDLNEGIFAGRICDEIRNLVAGGSLRPGNITVPVQLIHRDSS